MQQGDQTVFSLRPGGGRGSRLFNPRLEQSSVSSSSISSSAAAASSIAFGDLPSLRPGSSFKAGDMRFEGQERVRYTRDQLLQLREASVISDGILKVKQEIDAELFGEEPSWSRGESNPPNQPQTRYSEPDNRDLRGRAAQFSMFITGIHYKDDPTIMAWELMNEPRCTSDPTSRTIQLLTEEMDNFRDGKISWLSVLKNISSTIIALVTKKGAHHVDFRSATKNDPNWLVELRRKEFEIIKGWVDEYYYYTDFDQHPN